MNLNKLRFPWKPVDVQLDTISENAYIGDCYQCAKFHACIKKCTICLKFRAMPPDYWRYISFLVIPLLSSMHVITAICQSPPGQALCFFSSCSIRRNFFHSLSKLKLG